MNILRTKKCEVDIGGKDWFLISVYDHRLANKIKKLTGAYPDYNLKEGDEAMFKLKRTDVYFNTIMSYLFKSKSEMKRVTTLAFEE